MKLLLKLVRKDFKRNRIITTVLTVFLILAAVLMAGGLRVTGTIISSLNGLNEQAIPPQYLQMHKGTYDEIEFENFVKNHEYIQDSLIVKMLDISNANIIYKGETLEKCLMDNGFVTQNQDFDRLLNMDNELATVEDGEIGVPVYYAEELEIAVGDIITVHKDDYSKELRVSTIIRDSTMNPALTSSKRFLISQSDIDEISNYVGEWEECFEFLLKDGTSTSVLQKDYIDANMPSNGVAISGSILTMMNALSYGLVAFIILIISFLLILIAVLCLSYIIRATMEEENYIIGEMKAIGFPKKEIEKLYQIKYIILASIAATIGYFFAVPFGDFFSASVVKYCGDGTDEWMKWIFPFAGVVLLGLFIIIRCRRIIRKNMKSTVVELMRGEEKIKKEGHYSLPLKGLKYRNLTIALGELKCKWREYFVIFFVFIFSSFLILLPVNMKNTIENPSFITYMGVGECDIRIDIQYSEKLVEQKEAALSYLKNDSEIKKYQMYQNGYVQFQNTEGEWEYLRIENGDESVFPLQYLEGHAPEAVAPEGNKEMALSYLEALELGKKVGDSMTVNYQEKDLLFRISGIYQDITYGGKTGKAAIEFNENDVQVYIIYLDVVDGVNIQEKTNEIRNILTGSKITPISEFVSQTLGGIMDNMGMMEGVAIAIALLLIILITIMFLQLIIAREHSAIAIKKSIGFSDRDIRIQLGIRILMIQGAAIAIGTILANSLGETIFGLMLSSMGASKITMLVQPITAYLIFPFVQMVVVFITVMIATSAVKKYHIKNQIME